MKKKITFAMILMAVVVVVVVTACGANKKIYKYADDWEIPENLEKPILENEIEKLYDYPFTEDGSDPDSDSGISGPKKSVISYLGKYNFLSQDNVSTLKDRDCLLMETEYREEAFNQLNKYRALYDFNKKKIFLKPGYDSYYEENFWDSTYPILREMSRSMILKGYDQSTPALSEGLINYCAEEALYSADGEYYPLNYQGGMLAIRFLIAIYGEAEVIKMGHEDQFEKQIDSATKEGMARKIDAALTLAETKNDAELINVAYDILVHVAVSEGKAEAVKDIIKEIESTYSLSMGIEIDSEYMEKLLD